MTVEKKINDLYGGRLRVRACGFCFKDGKLLLLNHESKNGDLWLPPGGGVEYGESIKTAIEREFKEETHLKVSVEEYLFHTEFIDLPLHAIEIFHLVKITSGKEKLGLDPESGKNDQIIKDLKWFNLDEINNLVDKKKHKALQPENIHKLQAFF